MPIVYMALQINVHRVWTLWTFICKAIFGNVLLILKAGFRDTRHLGKGHEMGGFLILE